MGSRAFKNNVYAISVSTYEHSRQIQDEPDYIKLICFLMIHEIGHCLYREYLVDSIVLTDEKLRRINEEKFCNSLAVAFWHKYGTREFLEQIQLIVNNEKNYFENTLVFATYNRETNTLVPVKDFNAFYYQGAELIGLTEDNKSLAFFHWQKDSDAYYDHFQALSIQEAINHNQSLDSLLESFDREMQYKVVLKIPLEYGPMSIQTPIKIISDAREIFKDLGFPLPDISYTTCKIPNHCTIIPII